MVGNFSLSSILSFNKHGEALRYRGESGMKPSLHGSSPSPGKEDIQRFTP